MIVRSANSDYLKIMDKDDIISLSSGSSGPPSPCSNISQSRGFNDSIQVSSLNLENNYSFELRRVNNVSSNSNLELPQSLRIAHSLSESDESDCELPGINDQLQTKILQAKYGQERKVVPTSYLAISPNKLCRTNSLEMVDLITSPACKKDRKPHKSSTLTKEQRLQDKLKKDKEKEENKIQKQNEKEKKRAEKLALQKLQKQMRPGHCTKLMTVVLDDSLITCSFGGTLLAAIQNSESKCEVLKKAVPNTISWTRDLPDFKKSEEDDLIVIWQWQTVIPSIKNRTLCSEIQEVQFLNPSKTVFLIIYGLSEYFRQLKSKRRNASGELATNSKKRKNNELDTYPYLTRKAIEEELIELQLMANCNHRLIESSEDLAQFIVQITKAIAEKPFKLDKQRRELENLEWFAVGDSRDCVSVDKEGNGLLRLWQQQLCQFNLAGHDTAQAITAIYPSPSSLVEAYKKCTSQKEGEGLLKDIQVRRCQGPLSTSRRVGPELSKKIYTFFCSTEPETPLSQEQ